MLKDKKEMRNQEALLYPEVPYRLRSCQSLKVAVTDVGDPGSEKKDEDAWQIEKNKHSEEAPDKKVIILSYYFRLFHKRISNCNEISQAQN